MKNDRSNREKLNDALGMVDEELVQDAMLHAEGMRSAHLSRRAVIRRRVVVLAAACLSLCMVAGAMLAVPLLTAEDPAITEPPAPHEPGHESAGATSAEDTDKEEAFYVEAPIVQVVQLSATENATISDPSIPVDRVDAGVEQVNDFFANFTVLVFNCQPGETVTVKANTDCLGLVDMPWDANADWKTRREFSEKFQRNKHLYNPEWAQEGEVYFTDTLTVDPAVSSIGVRIRHEDLDMLEAVLTFTVTNEEGQTTGAGSFYINRKYLLNSEERALTIGIPFVSRSAVMGAVRFNDPATVTEEQVNELLDSFVARTEEVKAALDYSPVTTDEFNAYAMVDIIRTEFAGQKLVGGGSGGASWQDFSFCEIEAEDTAKLRCFVLLGDGNWLEYRAHGNCNWGDCHLGCPNQKEYGLHHGIGIGCILHTYDGRAYQVQKVSPDSERETLVLLEDPAA